MGTQQQNDFLLVLGVPAEMVAKLNAGVAGNGSSKASSGSGSNKSSPNPASAPHADKTAAKNDVTLVEPSDDQIQVAAQKPLGVINYRGRRGTLWAMTDPAGAIARGGKGPQADLAKMNELGAATVQYAKQMSAAAFGARSVKSSRLRLFANRAALKVSRSRYLPW
jgi:hypothetical protein